MKMIEMGLTILFHPTDTFYTIKRYRDRKLTGASILLIALLLLSRYLYITFLHYPVSPFDLRKVNITVDLLIHVGILFSIALASWNVSEILSGETFLRESLFNTALATVPLTVLYLPIAAVSNIMGQSEQIFLQIATAFMWAWAIFLLFRGIMVLNDYSFGKTVFVCILCAAYIAILWGVALVQVVFSKNLWQFVEGFVTELIVSFS